MPGKCLLVISVVLFSSLAQIDVPQNSDPCVDLAREAAFEPLQNFYPNYVYFLISLPTSRQLFRNLFTQTFTSSSFVELCQAYQNGRTEFDRCPQSNLKLAVLSGYRLADFVCIDRLQDFSLHLPCLQSATQLALDHCLPQCYQFEEESIRFLESPRDNEFLPLVDSPYLPGDCRYLNCMVSCRRPILASYCVEQAAELEWQALQITFQSMQKVHEAKINLQSEYQSDKDYYGQYFGYSPQYSISAISTFPMECQQMMGRDAQYSQFDGSTGTQATALIVIICVILAVYAG